MSRKIVITKINLNRTDLLLCGLMDDNRLIEARLDRLPAQNEKEGACSFDSDRLFGGIFIGKVERIVKNLNAAFVEIAPGVSCYLTLERVSDPVMVTSHSPGRIVQDDELLVQVIRDAARGKAPAVSTNLNFTGRYAILSTEKRVLGLSSKFDSATRSRFKKLLSGSLPENCGLIVRTNAKHVTDEEILKEIRSLTNQMDQVLSHAANRSCYSCLSSPKPVFLTYLQGAYLDDLEEVVTDIPLVYEALSCCREDYRDLSEIPLRLYEDDSFPLVSLYNLNREMVRATQREVRLKSGGFLVIEPTEAMTVIDVNTGKSTSGKDKQEHFVKINHEASREIILQLRLRNISGIIVVDFIDLDDPKDRRELLEYIRHLAKSDPIPVQVHDITALNLVEITRKKAEKSLSEQIKQLTINAPL
ncbi:MAG: ribonuclease E/G [Lachnospiraceae bacterium]|nr:ribonuclease E/G [Lachnospiraceae bacterium]